MEELRSALAMVAIATELEREKWEMTISGGYSGYKSNWVGVRICEKCQRVNRKKKCHIKHIYRNLTKTDGKTNDAQF